MIKKIINYLYHLFLSKLYTPRELIEKFGGKVGRGVFIGKDVLIDYDYAFLLEIGDGAVISARTIIELHDSSLPNVFGKGKNKIGRVIIGPRAYIGVNSVILPGIKIGRGAIVGACSLVNKDIPPGEVWAGIPVRFICMVNELQKKRNVSNSMIGYFDWIGEIEKETLNYQKLKRKFINQVRSYFRNK